MKIGTKEHYEILDVFERAFANGHRLDREPKFLWIKGCIYQDGYVNDMYKAFIAGYAVAKINADHLPDATKMVNEVRP
jgi:fructose-1,6-bisphosphatase